ncbi:CHY zinc finger protein [Halolamina litorea]|uniref:CHY zinc finger protein n=1 Tax=Halolamina litorea TaxID=1515593 RepID=A0ABD6BXE6_9EURY|nr:CHY zinc finger protein [Halolamina litorea]
MDVHGHEVRGVGVGPETRCGHYDSDLDVIAIRFPCCGTFYPCYECHRAVADHEAERWGATTGGSAADSHRDGEDGGAGDGSTTDGPSDDDGDATADGTDADAVLCGVCGSVLTVAEYVACEDRCPDCGAGFNPGCRTHYDRYFVEELFGDGS